MKNMELDQHIYEQIEAYLLNRVTEKERILFEAKLAANDEFREEVEFQRTLIEGLERESLERELRNIYEQQHKKKIIFKPWQYAIAASILVLVISVIAMIVIRDQNDTDKAYYALHDQNDIDPGPTNLLSSGSQNDLNNAMEGYRKQKYGQSIKMLSLLHTDVPTKDSITYYLGLSYLEDGQPNETIPLLETLSESQNKELRHKAQWYLALAYLKTRRVEEAKDMFNIIAKRSGQFRQKKAQQALEMLAEFEKD